MWFSCCCISKRPQSSAATECAAGFPISKKKKKTISPNHSCASLQVSVCVCVIRVYHGCVHSTACSLGGETCNREPHADVLDECCYEKGKSVCVVCNKLQMGLMCQCKISDWLRRYILTSLCLQTARRHFFPVCVGCFFCPAHMKTFFPCQNCSRRLRNRIVNPHTTRQHTTGKANTDMMI